MTTWTRISSFLRSKLEQLEDIRKGAAEAANAAGTNAAKATEAANAAGTNAAKATEAANAAETNAAKATEAANAAETNAATATEAANDAVPTDGTQTASTVAATVLTATFTALTSVGIATNDLQRVYRNESLWATVAMAILVVGVGVSIVAAVVKNYDTKMRLTIGSVLLFGVGFVSLFYLGAQSFSAVTNASVDVRVLDEGNGMRVQGTVRARGLQDNQSISVHLLGRYSATQGNDVQVPVPVDRIGTAIFGSTDGQIDKEFDLPIESGLYDHIILYSPGIITSSSAGSTSGAGTQRPRLNECPIAVSTPQTLQVGSATTCMELLLPRHTDQPNLTFQWITDSDAIQYNLSATNMRSDEYIQFAVLGEVDSGDVPLIRAAYPADTTGKLSIEVVVPLSSSVARICAIAISTDVQGTSTSAIPETFSGCAASEPSGRSTVIVANHEATTSTTTPVTVP